MTEESAPPPLESDAAWLRAGGVALACTASIAAIQMAVVPRIGEWADAAWARRGPDDPTVVVDLLDALRLLAAPLGFAAVAAVSWSWMRATTQDAALVVPRQRLQALLGAACAVLAFGMFTSAFMSWADPEVMDAARNAVLQTRQHHHGADHPGNLALTPDGDGGFVGTVDPGSAPPGGSGAPVDSAVPDATQEEPGTTHPLIALTETSGSGLLLAVTLLVVCVLAPVTEELLFRSVLFASLGRVIGMFPAAVLSTVLFTLVHLPIVTPPALVPIAALGAVLCLLTWRNGSVVPALAAHVTINALTMATAVSRNQVVPAGVGVALVPASLAAAVALVVWAGTRLERAQSRFRSSSALA